MIKKPTPGDRAAPLVLVKGSLISRLVAFLPKIAACGI